MTPFKIFLNLKAALTAAAPGPNDPLSHPDIFAMDLRQLADLPLDDAFYRPAIEADDAPAPYVPLARCA